MQRRPKRSTCSFGLLLLLLCPVRALAAEVGEIVLIEDVGGTISAGGLLPQVYVSKAACAFYADHQDNYDALVFFSTVPLNLLNGTPMGWPVKSPAKGIGLEGWPDQSNAFCSPRLRHAVRMGELAKLPDKPDGLYPAFPNSYTGIEVLGHEVGHQWLALVSFDKGDGVKHCMLRAFASAGSSSDTSCDGHAPSDYQQHWSFYFNSGSLMFGNTIEDLGGGSFLASNKGPKYSPLDQYLMGLRNKADVPPMFVVDKGDPASIDSAAPPLAPGVTKQITGTRLDFTVDDVIRAMGPRVPATEGCHWKAAFAIVHAEGKPPTAAEIAKVEAYRVRLETFYAWATDGRGSFDTTLAGTGQGTTGCPTSGIQPDGGPTPMDAAGSDLSVDGGAVGADATGTADGPPPSTNGGDDSGCGCQTGRAPAGAGGGFGLLWLLGLVAMASAVRPRRR